MKNDVKKDWEWADTFLPQIVDILKSNAIYILEIRIADSDKDTKEATDLVISVTGGDVAVRIRRGKYHKYRDWTIRSVRDSGAKTELNKLRDGFAKWYLYLWTDSENIVDWILVDLERSRSSGLLFKDRRNISNGDGTYFVAIPVNEIKRFNCLVSEYTAQTTFL